MLGEAKGERVALSKRSQSDDVGVDDEWCNRYSGRWAKHSVYVVQS